MRLLIKRGRAVPPSVVFVVFVVILSACVGLSTAQEEQTRAGRPLAPSTGLWFEQVVTHPHSDWQEDGRVSVLDEHVVLRNFGSETLDLSGWVLEMSDGTNESLVLEGTLGPDEPLVVMNPPGQINNDVSMRLLNDAGVLVDEATLGADGLPGGRGNSMLDEAVHLAGPWAGLRGPGALDRGLGPVWVSHLAVEGLIAHVDPLGPAWVVPEGGRVEVRLVVAPGHDPGPLELRSDGAPVALTLVDEEAGVWRSVEPLGPVHGNGSVELVGEGLVVGSFPSGDLLELQVDPVVPSLVGMMWPPDADGEPLLAAVADTGSRIRWLPGVETGPSGLVDVQVLDDQGAVLPDCVPLEDPGAGCVGEEGANMSLRVSDGAGRVVQETLPVVVWNTTPEVPGLLFEPAASPTLVWDFPMRPVKSIVVQVAEDPEGTWMVDEQEVPVDAGRFSDGSWVPGEPRAYRLVVTDLAGNRGEGPWVLLRPQDVPVQVEWDDAELADLGTIGEADVTLRFDRSLQEPPVLALRLERPVPLYLEVEGEPIVTEHAFVYRVHLPAQIEEAVGSWSLVGGRGEDGAPIDGSGRNLTWDAGAPRVLVDGVPDSWISAGRHVVTVRAMDGVDPAPVVGFPDAPAGATVSFSGAIAQVVLHEEGLHRIDGTARDASGNVQTFLVRIGLDATPPTVKELERPSTWSREQPVVFRVQDEESGVNHTSLKVWARDDAGVFEAALVDRGNGTLAAVPGDRAESVEGPFEVYVAVADQAGNGAEGFLSKRMRHVPSPDNLTRTSHQQVPEDGPADSQAPSFLGPPWGVPGQGPGSSIGGMQSADTSAQDDSRWDGFDWEDVPEKEEERSWGWYVAALVGAVTLGTVVHRVHVKRRGPKSKLSGDDAHQKAVDGEAQGGHPKNDRPVGSHFHDEHRPEGAGSALSLDKKIMDQSWVKEGEEPSGGGPRQVRLDLWTCDPLTTGLSSRMAALHGPGAMLEGARTGEADGGPAVQA